MPLPTGRPHISNETPGPALAVLAICSAGTSAVVAGSCILYQLKHRHVVRGSKLDLEWHSLLTAALAMSIAQSVVTAIQVQYGLGYQADLLTINDVTKFEQLEYTNNLLYIAALFFLKGVQFVLQFATTYQRPNYWIPAISMLGMLGFLFAEAFGCRNPFWKLRDNQCINQSAFWYAFGAFDIVTDIYSLLIVVRVSANLQLQLQSKIKLLSILASKFLPIICAIVRFPFIHDAYNSSNFTIALYELGMPTQLQLHLSIVALALGKLLRFLNFLDVGYLSSAIEPITGKGTIHNTHMGKSKYGYNSQKGNDTTNSRHVKSKPSIDDHDSSKDLVPKTYGRTITELGRVSPIPMQEMRSESDTKPNYGRHGGSQDEIRVTTQFEVRYENL